MVIQTSNFNAGEGIAKQTLNLFFIIDNSGSMTGEKIGAVNNAMRDITSLIPEIQDDTADAEIKVSVLVFSDYAKWISEDPQSAKDFKWRDIDTEAATNLSDAYYQLEKKLMKQSKGGMMPDFGGVAPVLFLMTDGLPTSLDWQAALEKLKARPWFRVALKYALAININEPQALQVLEAFTGSNETILRVSSAESLRKVIKIVAVTASKVKSQSTNSDQTESGAQNKVVQQEVQDQLAQIKGVEQGW